MLHNLQLLAKSSPSQSSKHTFSHFDPNGRLDGRKELKLTLSAGIRVGKLLFEYEGHT